MPRYKRTFKDWVKDYLQLNKWQRRATFVCLAVIAACILCQAWWLKKGQQSFQAAPKVLLQKVEELAVWQADSLAEHFASNENWREPAKEGVDAPAKYFSFDPNTATEQQWLLLGVKPKTVQSILKYRGKGGKFRKPEDLLKIYNLPKTKAEKLIPYVVINTAETNSFTAYKKDSFAARPVATRGPAQVDINLADTTVWIALPGIGSKLAGRIVNFRDKLGGFYSINQVAETYALPDSTFQKIRTRLVLTGGPFRLINLNTATIDELKAHPYIKWNIANAIVQYRTQHGAYQSVQELNKIALVEPAWFEKVLPYFTTR